MGDAILSCNGIDLQEAKHSEAVKVLSSLHGEIVMEVLYVAPDDSSDEGEADWEKKDEKRFTSILCLYLQLLYTSVNLYSCIYVFIHNNTCSFCIFIGRKLCVIDVHMHG